MSCQKAGPIVRLPQIVFVFVFSSWNLLPSNSRKQRQHIELLVSTFPARLLCYFPFDFICAFVGSNFFFSHFSSEMEEKQSSHDSVETSVLRLMFTFHQTNSRPPYTIKNSLEKKSSLKQCFWAPTLGREFAVLSIGICKQIFHFSST